MKAEELDRKFDDGEEVLQYFDLTSAKRPGLEVKQVQVNVDFPLWMLEALDRESQRLGVHRQVVIKTWIAEKLESQKV